MEVLDEFRLQARLSFDWLEAIVGDVTPEQALWRPPGRANTIAANYAHIVRNIDEDVNQRLFRRPMLNEGPWRGRTGPVPGRSDWEQGTQIDWTALREYGRAMSAFTRLPWTRSISSMRGKVLFSESTRESPA